MTNDVIDVENEIIQLAVECQLDPVKWAAAAWDWGVGQLADYNSPREWQDDINKIIRDHLSNPGTRYQPLQIAVASGHGIGKSAEMGMVSNWAMSCFDDCRVVVTANTDTQLKTKTAPEISKWFRSSITSHWFDVNATSIKSNQAGHRSSWSLDFVPWSEHNTEAFAGLHNKDRIILLLFDEASKIADVVWEVAEGALTDENTIIIWIAFGNPTRNSGRFRECFRKYRHRWITKQIDSRSVPGTNKEKIKQWESDYGEDSDWFKVRVRGLFPSASSLQFVGQDLVDAAMHRVIVERQVAHAAKIIGVDPSYSGEDEFAIYLRQGLFSKLLGTYEKSDDDLRMAKIIADFEDQHQADAVFIDFGYGTGIHSIGKGWDRDWRLVQFGGGSSDPQYLNKRGEMYGALKQWLIDGGSIDDQVTADEIVMPEFRVKTDGKVVLESKDDMKRRGLPSPNRADALAITFAFPVQPRAKLRPTQGQTMAQTEFDPFKDY